MHYSDVVHLASGFLQLVVAWYALQLGRAIGIKRTGWLLFSGLSLLTVMHVVLSFGPIYDRTEWEIKVDILYALFSVLLFVGMARVKILFAGQLRKKDAKLQKYSEMEARQAELEEKIALLTKANEDWPKAYQELQQTAARLQLELAEEKSRMAELTAANQQLAAANEQLAATHEQLLATHEQLRQEAAALQQKLAEEKRSRETVEKAYAELQAVPPPPEKPDVNLEALLHFNRQLENVDVSVGLLADRLAQSRSAQLGRLAKLMRDHSRNLANFVTRDPRGKQLPGALTQLAQQLSADRSALVRKVDSVKRKVGQLKGMSFMDANGEPLVENLPRRVEPEPANALRPDGEYTLQAGQTETITAAPEAEQPGDNPAPELLPETGDDIDASGAMTRPAPGAGKATA